MYLCGYSLDNLSLMALTIATGFRGGRCHRGASRTSPATGKWGRRRSRRRCRGRREIAFTVLSMSVSLVAVFIPILLMGGMVGTAVPGVCRDAFGGDHGLAHGLADHYADDVRDASSSRRSGNTAGSTGQASGFSTGCMPCYETTLRWALRHGRIMLLVTIVTLIVNVILFWYGPEGVLPRAGYRASQRQHPGGPGHLVSVDAGKAAAGGGNHQDRSGRGVCDRVHRRRWRLHHQHRPHVHHAESLRETEEHARSR